MLSGREKEVAQDAHSTRVVSVCPNAGELTDANRGTRTKEGEERVKLQNAVGSIALAQPGVPYEKHGQDLANTSRTLEWLHTDKQKNTNGSSRSPRFMHHYFVL
ncbi:hypothetical protein ZHAS_00005171 [Anopheles sinensis]|uniref:Uncharacterized protein n=1 Tax=Anopheles sinensis TaxID=74873 RepID=A0A084VIR2_ANOSI|nr:hypothetical protein ZHAS_00005171 [Anopheles sinensis]